VINEYPIYLTGSNPVLTTKLNNMEYTPKQISDGFIAIHKAAIMTIMKELDKIREVEGKEERIKYLEERLKELTT